MFAYIKGKLEIKSNNYVVIETNGIGYKIYMSTKAMEQLGEIGNNVKIHTHYYVREDNISLYGFTTNDELKMFELLLSVSGIGAKSAITMLSEITPSEFAFAIITNDITKLVKIQGIGKKTAARIVLELKDKLKTEEAVTKEEIRETSIVNETTIEEATSALLILGYTKKEIGTAFEKLEIQNLSTEDIIRKSLGILGK